MPRSPFPLRVRVSHAGREDLVFGLRGVRQLVSKAQPGAATCHAIRQAYTCESTKLGPT
ncbi:hypothetical protein HanRHA438_Chr10g0468341 [Helianthus annuus]|nr:hypothetical protein HanRHA438_Chr10g0468341 [Helianthus annuus]